MSGNKSVQETKQRKIQIEDQKRLEDMALMDQRYITGYSEAMPSVFKVDSKINIAKNYRKYEVYKAMKETEGFSYGMMEPAASYIIKKAHRCNDSKTGQLLLNLCRNTLATKESNETIMVLSDYLLAGEEWKEKDNPNREINDRMKKQGRLALMELYTRQLTEIDKKYGKKLLSMSSMDYLKRSGEIYSDLSCLRDMGEFFSEYVKELKPDEETALMAKKAAYYNDCLSLLEYRANIYVNNRIEDVTSKGELTKEKKKEYESLKRKIEKNAKDKKIFLKSKGKNKPLREFFEETEDRKTKALGALMAYQDTNDNKEEAIKALKKEFDLISEKLGEYENYKINLHIANNSEHPKNVRENARKVTERYIKKGIITDEGKITDLKVRRDVLAEKIGEEDSEAVVSDVTTDNVIEQIEKSEAIYKKLYHELLESSDDEFISCYSDIMTAHEVVDTQLKFILNSKLIADLRSKYDEKKGQKKSTKIICEDPELEKKIYKRFMDYYHLVTTGSHLMNKAGIVAQRRMEEIVKHGHTTGASLYQEENLDDASIKTAKSLSEYDKKAPRSFENLKRDLINPNFRKLDMKVLRELLVTIGEIRRYKEDFPDMYRCGQSYSDYNKCEFFLTNEEVLSNVFSYRLKLLGLDKKGKTKVSGEDYEELKRNYSAQSAVARMVFENPDNAVFSDEKKIQEEISFEETEQEEKIASYKGLNIDDELMQQLKEKKALSFLEKLPGKKEEGSTVSKETVLKDIKAIEKLISYSVDGKDTPEDEAISLYRIFAHRTKDVMDRMRNEGGFSDRAIANERKELIRLLSMGEFVKKHIFDTGLSGQIKERFKEVPEYSLDIESMGEFGKIYKRITDFSDYSTALFYGQIEDEVKMSRDEIILTKEQLQKRSSNAIRDYRIEHLLENTKEERRLLLIKQRAVNAMGQEMVASARKNKSPELISLMDWFANRLGAPLQALSWLLHEKRTDLHGEVMYEKMVPKMDKLISAIPEMEDSFLPDFYRDDIYYAPPVELDKYFASPMKKDILDMIRTLEAHGDKRLSEYKNDEKDQVFLKAIRAINYYTKVVGIVNSDTTEMEMACLDTFMKCRKEYREYYGEVIEIEGELSLDESERHGVILARTELLDKVYKMFKDKTGCLMEETMDMETLREIDEKAISYVEDTLYSENMEESNIKDIPLFLHEPNINDVRQSSIGDCWLVSAISAIVKTNPDYIRSMFHDNGKGDVIVRLYTPVDSRGNEVAKNHMFDDGVKMVPSYFKLKKHYETGYGNASDCTWVQLLEKAYALGGYNSRNEVKVRGNKLFNVADELTMGFINCAMKVITGETPEKIKTLREIPETGFLSNEMSDGLIAGLGEAEWFIMEEYLGEIKNNYEAADSEDKNKYCYKGILSKILEDREKLFDKYLSFNEVLRNEIDSGDVSEEELLDRKTEWIKGIKEKMEDNLNLMMDGKPLEFSEAQLTISESQNEAMAEGFLKSKLCYTRKQVGRYFYEKRSKSYENKTELNTFIKNIEYCIRKKGNVGISIPHCVDIIDVKWSGDKCFFLMRDPFNIYNISYGKDENGALTRTSEGFGSVISKRKENRNLVGDTAKELLTGGFRGTSWYLASDIYSMTNLAYMMLPEHLNLPDFRVKEGEY